MTQTVVSALAFISVFLAVFAGSAVLVDLRSDEKKRLLGLRLAETREAQRKRARLSAHPTPEFANIAQEALAEAQEPQSFAKKFNLWIDQSGLDLSAKRLLGMVSAWALAGGLLMGAIGGVLFDFDPSALAISFIFGVLVLGGLPLAYVHLKRLSRIEKLRNQLPDAFDLMSRVLRSGQTISQAMQAVADEFAPPLALEFLYCSEQMKMGLSIDTAFREMGQRTGLLEMRIFTLAVVVHRQTGGNLAELFDKLAHVVRERFRINGMISSLTAQGRFQAVILLSLPPFMFLLLMILHREYEMILLGYPLLILLALTMMGLGGLWIRKIVNFDY